MKRKLRPRRRRVALRLAYDGSGFRGFQRQPGQRTVEGVLVEALVQLGLTGGLGFASRTDAGVHAEGQVVALPIDAASSPEAFQASLQALLPPDLSVRACVWAPERFHPRWSATGKRYVYRLAPGLPLSAGERLWRLGDVALPPALFAAPVAELLAAPALDGFTAAGAEPTPAPPLTGLRLAQEGDVLALTFEGPAFRRYAIRHMVGALVEQALGRAPAGSLEARARSAPPYRGLRAPGEGLVLEEVHYPPVLDPFR